MPGFTEKLKHPIHKEKRKDTSPVAGAQHGTYRGGAGSNVTGTHVERRPAGTVERQEVRTVKQPVEEERVVQTRQEEVGRRLKPAGPARVERRGGIAGDYSSPSSSSSDERRRAGGLGSRRSGY